MSDSQAKTPTFNVEQMQQFQAIVAERESGPPGRRLNLYEHARRGDLLSAYNELYRFLSTAAAHPSNTITNLQTTWTDEQRQVEFGPDSDAGGPLIRSTAVMLLALRQVNAKAEMGADPWREAEELQTEIQELAARSG